MQGPTSQLPSYSSSVDPPPAYKAKKRDVKSNPDVVGFGAATLDISFLNDIYGLNLHPRLATFALLKHSNIW